LEGLDEAGQIHKLIDLFYDFVREHMQSIRFVLSLILREEKQPDDPVARVSELFRIFRNLLNDILESGRQKGVFRADMHPQSEASLIMCALAGALVQRFIGSDFSGESENVVAHLKKAILERLRAETG
jgi:tetracycline repressor-like protein